MYVYSLYVSVDWVLVKIKKKIKLFKSVGLSFTTIITLEMQRGLV